MIRALILPAITLCLVAQDDTATIAGQVLLNDRRPGVFASSIQVELNREDRPGEALKVSVNADGEYRLMNLKSGTYIITVTAPGYKPATARIELISGTRVRGNTKLVLLPESSPKAERHSGVVSQNELRAPRRAVRQAEIAERSMDGGDFSAAARAVDKALEIWPAYARALVLRGRLSEKQGRPREAARSYEKALEGDSDAYPAYAALAEIHRLEGDHKALRDVADRWKKAQPLSAAPYYYGALASFQAGQFLVAVDEALMARRFPHENLPHLNLLLANCYIKLRDPSAAAAQMREFLASRPDDPMAPEVRRSLEALEKIARP